MAIWSRKLICSSGILTHIQAWLYDPESWFVVLGYLLIYRHGYMIQEVYLQFWDTYSYTGMAIWLRKLICSSGILTHIQAWLYDPESWFAVLGYLLIYRHGYMIQKVDLQFWDTYSYTGMAIWSRKLICSSGILSHIQAWLYDPDKLICSSGILTNIQAWLYDPESWFAVLGYLLIYRHGYMIQEVDLCSGVLTHIQARLYDPESWFAVLGYLLIYRHGYMIQEVDLQFWDTYSYTGIAIWSRKLVCVLGYLLIYRHGYMIQEVDL